MRNLELPSNRLLLALSGGADSVALFLMLLEHNVSLVAAHCNFHLRGAESDRDELFVRDLCAKYNVPLRVQHFDTTREAAESGESVEMVARRLRYAWFEELRQIEGLDYICTAHHRDDQVETILLNIARGTGLSGLRGMLPIQGRVCRPLLSCYGRDELRQYLKEKGESWVEDSSNDDTHYQRNLVRHKLIPSINELNAQSSKHICDLASHVHEAESRLENMHENWEEEHCVILPDGLRIPFSAKTRVGAELTTNSPIMVVRTAVGLEVRMRPQRIPPTPIEARVTAERPLNLYRKDRCYLDVEKLHFPLYYRTIGTADRFVPFGMKGTRLVSDYLTDRHRSRVDKLAQLVVCDQEGIVWLCGETITQRVAISEQTREICEIWLEDLEKC